MAVTTTDVALISDEQRDFYATNGYLQLERFVSQEWLDELQAASQEFVELSRELAESNKVLDVEPGHTSESPRLRRLISPLDHHDVFYRFTTQGPPAQLAQELLGGPVRFHHSKLNYKWSGAAARRSSGTRTSRSGPTPTSPR